MSRCVNVQSAEDGLACTYVSSDGAILPAKIIQVPRDRHELVVYMVPDVGSDTPPDTPANQARFITAVWHTMMKGCIPPAACASSDGAAGGVEEWFEHAKLVASRKDAGVRLHKDKHRLVRRCWVQLDETVNMEQKLDEPGFGWMCTGGRMMIHFVGPDDPTVVPLGIMSSIVSWVRSAWEMVKACGATKLEGISRFDIAGHGGTSRVYAASQLMCVPPPLSDSHMHMLTIGDIVKGSEPGSAFTVDACIVVAGAIRGVTITSSDGHIERGANASYVLPRVTGLDMDSLIGRWGVSVLHAAVRSDDMGVEWTDILLSTDEHETQEEQFKLAVGWLVCEGAACVVGSHIRSGLFEFCRGSEWIHCPSVSRSGWRLVGHPTYRTYPVFVDVFDSFSHEGAACILPGNGAHSRLPANVPYAPGIDPFSLRNLMLHARGEGPLRGTAFELACLSCIPAHDLCHRVDTLVGVCGLPWGVVSMPGAAALRYPTSVYMSRVAASVRTGIQPCLPDSFRIDERLAVVPGKNPPGGIITSVMPGLHHVFLSYDISQAYPQAVSKTDVPYLLVGWSQTNMERMRRILTRVYGAVTVTCLEMTDRETCTQGGCQSWTMHSPGMVGPFWTYLQVAKRDKLQINATVGVMGRGYVGSHLQQAAVAGISVVRHAVQRMLDVSRNTLVPCRQCSCCHSTGEVFDASCDQYIAADAQDDGCDPGSLTDEVILPGVHPSCARYTRGVLQAAINMSPLASGLVLKEAETGVLVVWATTEMIVLPMRSDGVSSAKARGARLNMSVSSHADIYIRDARVALFFAAVCRVVLGGPYGGWASAIDSLRRNMRKLQATHSPDDMTLEILAPVESMYGQIGGTPPDSLSCLKLDMERAAKDEVPLAERVNVKSTRRKRKHRERGSCHGHTTTVINMY